MAQIDLANSLDLPKRTVALVLAGGRGSRLKNLTDRRAKPAVYFGGKFRIIDFALSNCLNSGIRRIGVITQYKSHSLLRHLQRGWAILKPEMNEFIDLLPAQQRTDEESWYRGTADAVYQNQDIIASYRADYVLVLAGDHIYKQNYALMIADHVAKGRECTVGCIAVPRSEASAFGVMAVDEKNNITDFVEKPADPPAMPDNPDMSLASMGIYVFNARYLYKELERDLADPNSSHDFGKDIIPRAVKNAQAAAHPFSLSCVRNRSSEEPYWRDVGTIDAYWDANIDLTATVPHLDLYDTRWPIWTYQAQLPPAKFVHNEADRRGMAIESVVSGGCIVSGHVERTLLFNNVRVHSHSHVSWSVVLPGVQIGRGARVHRAVIDRDCVIPDGMVIGEDAELDSKRFYRSENGITLVTRDMLAALQT
ncbi:glucose-1-phosphate adenylyltransferase [Viridibacterium curvum]|uniref:Glucose-1-phosphate adenylyltransferase n=1 Tax=Viridibacterium curvum TaxID=1101404 RepID=A0ABP9QJD7_9RHOO